MEQKVSREGSEKSKDTEWVNREEHYINKMAHNKIVISLN